MEDAQKSPPHKSDGQGAKTERTKSRAIAIARESEAETPFILNRSHAQKQAMRKQAFAHGHKQRVVEAGCHFKVARGPFV